MPGQSLCTGGGIAFWELGTLFVGFIWFSLEVHAFHGVDYFCLFCMCSLFHSLSQRRVGDSYALRVSPAVTRLTVYRRPQVMREGRTWVTQRGKLCGGIVASNGACSGCVRQILIRFCTDTFQVVRSILVPVAIRPDWPSHQMTRRASSVSFHSERNTHAVYRSQQLGW